ncbi:MAG: hypothetical protein FJ246_04325 [Nitrospira sp.]|nr:hypothetical protein [Nitrospira sp.]
MVIDRVPRASRAILLPAVVVGGALGLFLLDLSVAQPLGDATATTESSCNFGMAKGQAKGSCVVPFLQGCVVARFPGTTKPWSNISKGGLTACRFDDKGTDWKTRIAGTCEKCKSAQCSARFGVMFDCSAHAPAPTAQSPKQHTP